MGCCLLRRWLLIIWIIFHSLKAVPFTLPPAPSTRAGIAAFNYPLAINSPCRESLDQPDSRASERRPSVSADRRPSFSDRLPNLPLGDRERRPSVVEDSNGRRDSVSGLSVCSDSTEGGGSPTYGNSRTGSRRSSVADVMSPAGKSLNGLVAADLLVI